MARTFEEAWSLWLKIRDSYEADGKRWTDLTRSERSKVNRFTAWWIRLHLKLGHAIIIEDDGWHIFLYFVEA